MPEIVINTVSKTYLSEFKREKKMAVCDVSLLIKPGDIFGIIGRNGAGKSTAIKMIMGFIRPDSGEITIDGKSPQDPLSRLNTGYLPENPYFYDNLTAEELLKFSGYASGMPKSATGRRIELLLKKVGLYEVRKQRLRTYSKGMTQRVGICFALVHDPKIVILDEPMSGLDPFGRKMVIDLIKELKENGKTVLFCSHILNDVERVCDRVAVMDSGKLKQVFTKEQILESRGMEALFIQTVEPD